MTILDTIIHSKRQEIAKYKKLKSIADLEKEIYFSRECFSLKNNLLQTNSGIISEFKRKSPSKGWIHPNADVLEVTKGYSEAGASGISILTDFPFFGGSPADLISARPYLNCPILRKDFVIDEYQLYEAKAMGADVILLIAAALTPVQTKMLAKQAQLLGLEVLLEVHNREELENLNEYVDMLGVNNRNLKTFEVSTEISNELAKFIPEEFVKLSESGISSVETVRELREYGYKGFLMGENFMKEKNPGDALKRFIEDL
jgi:indole-3-glycerol phosphate synthase